MNSSDYVLIATLFLCSGSAFPQQIEKEPAAVVELGVAPGWSLKDGGSSIGPTVAIEVTPIENWLELEAGVTPTFAHHSTEWDTDLLLKKPWTLSKKLGFMFGVGPVWVYTRENGMTRNPVGAEAVLSRTTMGRVATAGAAEERVKMAGKDLETHKCHKINDLRRSYDTQRAFFNGFSMVLQGIG